MASSRSTRRGSQYLAAEEELSVGQCEEHNRLNEAFCEVCKILICPSCLMFGAHQGHKVLTPGQAVRLIRDLIDKNNKAGRLNPEFSDRVLGEIRENKAKTLKAQNNVMNQIQENFTQALKTLKNRRKELIDEVDKHFSKELSIVEDCEKDWEKKEKMSKKVLEIAQGDSDEEVLLNCFTILDGIDCLDLPVSFKNLDLLENIDFSVYNTDISKIIEILKSIGSLSDKKVLQFRS